MGVLAFPVLPSSGAGDTWLPGACEPGLNTNFMWEILRATLSVELQESTPSKFVSNQLFPTAWSGVLQRFLLPALAGVTAVFGNDSSSKRRKKL